MVAAFSCNDFGLYNSFVVTYQKALQDSDKALEAYFLRRNAGTGVADYHSFKTNWPIPIRCAVRTMPRSFAAVPCGCSVRR